MISVKRYVAISKVCIVVFIGHLLHDRTHLRDYDDGAQV